MNTKTVELQSHRFSLLSLAMVTAWMAFFTASKSSATMIADLATDYKPATSTGQSSDDVGISGTVQGTWHYFQDPDLSTVNGNGGLLTWQSSPSYRGGSTYGYSGTIFDWGLMPVLANEQLFENAGQLPPAGSLMGHPGTWYLAVQYSPTAPIADLFIDYRFEKPNSYGTATATIFKSDGTTESVLLPTTAFTGATILSGTLSNLGTLSTSQSIWMFIGDGGDWAGDQSFLKLSISDVPEPSSAILVLIGLLACQLARVRR